MPFVPHRASALLTDTEHLRDVVLFPLLRPDL